MQLVQKPIEAIVNKKLNLLGELIRLTGSNISTDDLRNIWECPNADVRIRHNLRAQKITYEEADELLDKLLIKFDEFKKAFIEVLLNEMFRCNE